MLRFIRLTHDVEHFNPLNQIIEILLIFRKYYIKIKYVLRYFYKQHYNNRL